MVSLQSKSKTPKPTITAPHIGPPNRSPACPRHALPHELLGSLSRKLTGLLQVKLEGLAHQCCIPSDGLTTRMRPRQPALPNTSLHASITAPRTSGTRHHTPTPRPGIWVGYHSVPTTPLGSTIPSLGCANPLLYLIPSCWGKCPGTARRPSSSLCRQVKQKQKMFLLQHKHLPPTSPRLPSSLPPPFCHGRFPEQTGDVPPQGSCKRVENQSTRSQCIYTRTCTSGKQLTSWAGKHNRIQETKLFPAVKFQNNSAGFFMPGKKLGLRVHREANTHQLRMQLQRQKTVFCSDASNCFVPDIPAMRGGTRPARVSQGRCALLGAGAKAL